LKNHIMYLTFSVSDTILPTVSVVFQTERSGNSQVMNYKLNHITYSNAFSSHFSAFQLMSNVTVKLYKFHVYTLNYDEWNFICNLYHRKILQ
jgi:hypothetical protein